MGPQLPSSIRIPHLVAPVKIGERIDALLPATAKLVDHSSSPLHAYFGYDVNGDRIVDVTRYERRDPRRGLQQVSVGSTANENGERTNAAAYDTDGDGLVDELRSIAPSTRTTLNAFGSSLEEKFDSTGKLISKRDLSDWDGDGFAEYSLDMRLATAADRFQPRIVMSQFAAGTIGGAVEEMLVGATKVSERVEVDEHGMEGSTSSGTT
jgi:hypothetical protein